MKVLVFKCNSFDLNGEGVAVMVAPSPSKYEPSNTFRSLCLAISESLRIFAVE